MRYFYCSIEGDELHVNCVATAESYCIHKGGNYNTENLQKLYELFDYKSVRFVYNYFTAFAPIAKENFLCNIFGKTQIKFW